MCHLQVSVPRNQNCRSSLAILAILNFGRIRRVKCDEGKPSCVRCQSTGRICDGYTTVNSKTSLLAQQTSPPLLLSRIPISAELGSEQERHYFSFFHKNTAAVLAGYFDSSFWERLVLQVSVSEPAVRHAIVALGSLHEFHEKNQLLEADISLENKQLLFCLKQYTKSICHLNRHIAAAKSPLVDIVLICCVLFITLESFQGNPDSTTSHLQNGSKILSKWQSDQSHTNSTVFLDDLLPIFTRLKVQVKSLLANRSLLVDFSASISIPAPIAFLCLREARNCLYLLLNDVFDFIQNDETYVILTNSQDEEIFDETAAEIAGAAEEKTSMFSSSRSPSEIDQAHEKRDRIEALLLRWLSTYDKFVSQSSVKMNSQDLCAAILLKIHYICSWLLLKTCHTRLETAYDEYVPYFGKVVALCESLIKDSAPDDRNTKHLDLWFDMGIIGPLYFTASRCRDPAIRRKAIELLGSHGREGACDAEGAAVVAERIVALEEEGLGMVNDAKDIPEYARIHVVKVSIRIVQRYVNLSCYNPNAPLGGQPKFRKERVRW